MGARKSSIQLGIFFFFFFNYLSLSLTHSLAKFLGPLTLTQTIHQLLKLGYQYISKRQESLEKIHREKTQRSKKTETNGGSCETSHRFSIMDQKPPPLLLPLLRHRRLLPPPPPQPTDKNPLRRGRLLLVGRQADGAGGGEAGGGGDKPAEGVRKRGLLLQPDPRGAVHQDLPLRRHHRAQRHQGHARRV